MRFEARQDFAALHQYLQVVLREVQASFDRVVAAVDLNPAYHNMGDVYWDAEQTFGANPLDISAHTGLMLLSRGVALSEVIFASIPSKLLTNAEELVYVEGRSWTRKQAGLFYKTCLAHPVNIGNGFMQPIAQMRDLYAHGYGRPHRTEIAERLARALHPYLGPAEPAEEEKALGFIEGPYAFGWGAPYSPATGFSNNIFSPLAAELSPLATRRLLLLIEQRVNEAFDSASFGIKMPLTPANSRFVRDWVREQEKRETREREQAQARQARDDAGR
jgi:hypothetical protein